MDYIQLLAFPDSPEYFLQSAVNNQLGDIRRAVAENPNTSIDLLKKFASHQDNWTRRAVAKNSNASTNTLAQLIPHSFRLVFST